MRIIFLKETRDLLRDGRTLFYLFAAPIVAPILFFIVVLFMVWQLANQISDGLPIAIINGEQMPPVVAELNRMELIRLSDVPPDIEAALQNGDLAAVLEVPPDAAARLEAEQPVTVTLTAGRGGWLPDVAITAFQDILENYEDELLEERLARRSLDPAWLDPIRLDWKSSAPTGVAVAPTIEGGNLLSTASNLFVIMLVISWVFSGGLNVMSDMTIGEKEHHTMEPLLVTPSNRLGIALGKIALATLISIITVAVWSAYIIGSALIFARLPGGLSGKPLIPSFTGNAWGALFWLIWLMLPLMLTVNAIVAAMSTLARNYRESNLFLGILQLLLPALGMIAAFSISAKPSPVTYMLPLLGTLVAIRDLFSSGIAPEMLMLVWGFTVLYAVLAILLMAYFFSREWALMRGM